ncbi:MAG: CRISPR-associated protein Csx19 [bacterium]|nr:CRISPR-associated protein Csx19 [bacterium]
MIQQYELKTCNTQVKSITDDQALMECIKTFSKAKAVAWYYDEIVFYSIENNLWNTAAKGLDELVRLRIFNNDQELHIWRSNGVLKGRLRADTKGNDIECVDAMPLLNGTAFDKLNPGIIASEEKGIHYYLPYPELEILVGSKNRIALLTRNYIGYSDIGQAGYIDCRFVDFKTVNTLEKNNHGKSNHN